MIDFINGILAEKNLNEVTVDTGGVGYHIEIPVLLSETLPEVGSKVTLLTHFHVREDTQRLYGFATKPQRELFRRLIAVSGIGPRVALNILSRIPVEELVGAVASGDAARLKSIPGIGIKTAERLVVELRGKLKDMSDYAAASVRLAHESSPKNVKHEAYQAMIALGYTEKLVKAALERVEGAQQEKDAPVEEWIRKALQVI